MSSRVADRHDESARSFRRRAINAAANAAVPERVETLMLNVGLRCDSQCPNCHHSCSPSRTEVMPRETMLDAIELAARIRPDLVDITGGEPTLFDGLRELVSRLSDAGVAVRVRTNLAAMARADNADLPSLFARYRVAVLATLRGTSAATVAEHHGGVSWDATLDVLRTLAALGYGAEQGSSPLRLDLAYNPPLGEMIGSQNAIESEFDSALTPLGVRFDSLLAIGNTPVGRFRQHLVSQGDYESYVGRLAAAFNPSVIEALACRHGIEVDWDGTLWDCDFNLGAQTAPARGPATLAEVLDAPDAAVALADRRIGFAAHCYACTAGSGSS